jgi:hypothetical protein
MTDLQAMRLPLGRIVRYGNRKGWVHLKSDRWITFRWYTPGCSGETMTTIAYDEHRALMMIDDTGVNVETR